ncbi:MAG: hypothetical protein IKQ35_02350 [Bacilli bacterium]|nr:hypothetical protein [Bacilli bacterium]
MTKDFFNNFIRNLFCSIDYFIYSSIEWVTQGIFDISELRTNINIVSQVRNKLYVLLGIFMLFRISITLINYMINPEQMTDRERGIRNLVGKTIAMIALLIMLPTIFGFLYRAQKAFLPVLPRVLLGKNVEKVTETVTKNSNQMAVTVLQAFFHPYYSEKASDEFASINGAKEIEDLDDFVQHVNDTNYIDIPLLGDGVTGYSYEYRFFLSTIVGMVILGLLLSLTLDIAIRLFKMLILEMLAPIPIIGSIAPSNGRDSPFQSWLKELTITFADIFIKLSLVYLVLYFVTELNNNSLFVTWESAEGSKINPLRLMYLKVFLIVGLLIFAQQAPKFIRKIFGIRDGDEGNFLGSVAGGISGFGSGLISGAISGQGLRGAISGGVQGASAGYQNALAKGNASIRSSSFGENGLARDGSRGNSKSGILANLQNLSSNSKLRAESSKANISDSSLENARTTWQQAQNLAYEAEGNYRNLIAAGPQEGESVQDYNNRRTTAYNDWQTKASRAKEAESNYQTTRASYEKSGSGGGPVHRARKKIAAETGANVNKNTSTSIGVGASTEEVRVGGSTIEARRSERTSNQNNG